MLFHYFFSTSVASKEIQSDKVRNSPPVVLVDNHWNISEDQSVDTIVGRVQASDKDPNDKLTFGLEADNGTDVLPFRINRDTGIVYLNESLEGRGGENIRLYVTVTDGTYNVKNSVFANIKPKISETNANRNGSSTMVPLPAIPTQSPYLNAHPLSPNIYRNSTPNYRQTKTYPEQPVSPTHADSGKLINKN